MAHGLDLGIAPKALLAGITQQMSGLAQPTQPIFLPSKCSMRCVAHSVVFGAVGRDHTDQNYALHYFFLTIFTKY